MQNLRSLLAMVIMIACTNSARALDYVYPDGQVTTTPLPDPAPLPATAEDLRKIDRELGNCLKASGGRMTPRCTALREQSDRLAGKSSGRPSAAGSN